MKPLKVIIIGSSYWATQNIVETFIIIVLGYLGIDVMSDFCMNCSFIDNLLGTAWWIGIKALIFFLPYLLLFIIINFIPYFESVQNKFKYAVLNAIISCSIIIIIGVLKPKGLKEIILPLFASSFASIVTIFYTKYKAIQ